MIRAERDVHILSALREAEAVSIRELVRRLRGVSEVTIRRDILRLAEQGALERTRGGARRRARMTDGEDDGSKPAPEIEHVDAIVLPPIAGRGANTLRMRAGRRNIPFLAESSPQEGGIYLGPDNFAAGYDLGALAARMMGEGRDIVRILLVSLEELPNTRARSEGFIRGFRSVFRGDLRHWKVDGKGDFRTALRVSLDALTAHRDIDVVFGVNDHSVLGAIEAADQLGLDHVRAFCVGGEGGSLFDVLAEGRRLKAAAALFPEVVGALGVDVIADALAGKPMPAEVRTPHAILTPQSLQDYYRPEGNGWVLAGKGREFIGDARPRRPGVEGRTIGFMPHYPAHDWYRTMARAMRERAQGYGLDVALAPPSAGIAREIEARRVEIARAAVRRIEKGDTILVNAGPVCPMLAAELEHVENVTVVTNSLDLMHRLAGKPGLKVILTSGEYQPAARCLVGPSLGALFETMRVDKAFISIDGISVRFGPSAADERIALAAWRFIEASRQVYVLADHSLVELDANHRIAPLAAVGELITDSGSLPTDRHAFASAGVRVAIADEELLESETPPPRHVGLAVEV